MEDKESIHVRNIEREQKLKFRSKAAREGKSMTAKLKELITKYLNE